MNEKLDIDVKTLKPFTKFIYTIGELPTSYLMSMTYEEQLVWLCNYLAQTIIPTINNNAEAVKEVQDLVLQLQEYINNYFDNLDVQEEINNKLDEMAESGQLTDIIAQYLGLAGVLAFNTVSDMKNATNLVNGSTAKTLGYHSLNDGGGAFYKVRTVTNDDTIDEMTIISLYDNTLIAELIYADINVKCLGAYGDNTHDDTIALQTAINKSYNIFIPKGTYLISTSLKVKNDLKISGVKETNSIIKATSDISIFENNSGSNYITIKNLKLTNNITSSKYAINIEGTTISPYNGATYSLFENIFIDGFESGIFLNHVWNTELKNIRVINGTTNGIFLGGGCNNILIDLPMLEHLTNGIRISTSTNDSTENTNITILDADIEYCTNGIYTTNNNNINIINLYTEHNTKTIYSSSTNSLTINGFYSAYDTKLADLNNTKANILGGYIKINSSSDIGIISTNKYINLENITGANDSTGKIFYLASDVNSYNPTFYNTLYYNVESESFRLRYSSDKLESAFNTLEKDDKQYSCFKPCLVITSNTLTASSGDTINFVRNGTTIATINITNGTALTKDDILEFNPVNTNGRNFIYKNGDEYSITHTNTTGVDVNFKVLFRNIKTGNFISNI